jgi:hypothetical protein
MNGSILYQIVVLNTKTNPYEWFIPQVAALNDAPKLLFHSATLIGNYMLINFGNYVIYIQSF